MDLRDIVRLGTEHLSEKKARTALTILMVVIGVASIVALTSQTAGEAQSIQNSLGSLGPTSLLVVPSGKTIFTAADVANLEALQNVSSVTPIITGQGTLSLNGNNYSVSILGMTSNGLQSLTGNTSTLYQGSFYPDGITPDAIVGHGIAFSSQTNQNQQTAYVGDTGTLEMSGTGTRGGTGSASRIAVPIVGILQSQSTSLVSVDSAVVVSLQYAQTLLHTSSYSELLVKANTAQNVSALTSLLEVIYGNNARVINTQQLANTISSVQSSTSQLLIIIAGVSLLVAAVGIMNMMLMAVSERIHDIGILKSVGFEAKDIMLIFLFQAIVIGIIGGATGLAAGATTSYAISLLGGLSNGATGHVNLGGAGATPESAAGQGTFFIRTASGISSFQSRAAPGQSVSTGSSPISSSSSSSTASPVFTVSIILEAIMVAIAISMIAGIYPAWKASKMEPIDALRTL